jgi:hypothetical protein
VTTTSGTEELAGFARMRLQLVKMLTDVKGHEDSSDG